MVQPGLGGGLLAGQRGGTQESLSRWTSVSRNESGRAVNSNTVLPDRHSGQEIRPAEGPGTFKWNWLAVWVQALGGKKRRLQVETAGKRDGG